MSKTLAKTPLMAARVFTAIAILFVAAHAHATGIPLASLDAGCRTGTSGTLTCGPGIGTTTILSQVSLTIGPSAEQTIATTTGLSLGGGLIFVKYWGEVQSSSGVFDVGSVPLLITTHGFTDVTGAGPTSGGTGSNGNFARAIVSFNDVFGSLGRACTDIAAPTFCGVAPSSFSQTFSESVDPAFGTLFSIEVDVETGLNSNFLTSSAHAFADPFVQIDPAYLALHPTYSLVFSAGVTNTDPNPPAGGPGVVPEPTSMLLLGTGLVVGGVRRWLRRRKAA